MGYVFYSAKIKVMAVLLILNGKTDIEVHTAIVDNPYNKTIDHWVALYKRTSAINKGDPPSSATKIENLSVCWWLKIQCSS
ncbi:hypothetical protein CROQUDRAFT_665610 [Cronartium quercuum f. sp. fusiforme G11]|uniref:Uncharacterized protein n=1 Tax=Cronartium quercuum f. sp. fusiforme G11 TaxID=708437 RepID=A0A9P6NA61_9BASI|nr:hypothetical protein CROQUDRAFT_665610 [Cronartium quercuum f. sp. fusiforme G11]